MNDHVTVRGASVEIGGRPYAMAICPPGARVRYIEVVFEPPRRPSLRRRLAAWLGPAELTRAIALARDLVALLVD